MSGTSARILSYWRSSHGTFSYDVIHDRWWMTCGAMAILRSHTANKAPTFLEPTFHTPLRMWLQGAPRSTRYLLRCYRQWLNDPCRCRRVGVVWLWRTDGAFDSNVAAWLIFMESSAPIQNHPATDRSAPSTSPARPPFIMYPLVPELLELSGTL
jgi:hypothetical protein